MNKLFISALVLFCILESCNSPSVKKSALTREQIMANASRTEKNGWIKIHLEGTPDVIGFQHGYLLADEIIDLRGAMEIRNLQMTGRDREFYRNESYRILWHNIPSEYQEELNGIVAGVNARLGDGKIDIKDILAINALLEIPDYYVPWLENQEKPSPPEHCSAFAATGSWTRDGKIVLAHNNWSEYLIGERWNIIVDIVPSKGNRIFMDALPGFIHSGDDFGHMDEDEKGTPGVSWDAAYFAAGAVQGKATDGNLAAKMQFWAIMGHPCGQPFIAKSFLEAHPDYNIQKDFLRDMPGQVWTLFEEK